MIPEKDKKFFRENYIGFFQLIPFAVIGIIIPLCLIALNLVDKKWFIYGPVTWMGAIAIKTAPFFINLFIPAVKIRVSNIYVTSIWEGFLSATSELGLTFLFF